MAKGWRVSAVGPADSSFRMKVDVAQLNSLKIVLQDINERFHSVTDKGLSIKCSWVVVI